jgi:hypothetical protein
VLRLVPAGFAVEAVPDPIEVETPFLRYAARLKWGQNERWPTIGGWK